MRSHALRRLTALVGLSLAVTVALGCSSDEEDGAATPTTTDVRDAYCDAWADLVAAFDAGCPAATATTVEIDDA